MEREVLVYDEEGGTPKPSGVIVKVTDTELEYRLVSDNQPIFRCTWDALLDVLAYNGSLKGGIRR